jgi:hypothetical protein
MSNEAKCNCQHCSGHISFPVEMVGQTLSCPHCQLETPLFLPPVATAPKPRSGNTAFFANIIGIILVVGVVIAGVAIFIRSAKDSKPSAQNSDNNLQEVKGALGWNLGDVLPNNLQVKIDDEIYGITYDFDPPAEVEKDALAECFLILTEDRRIAAIRVKGRENDHFNALNLQKVLKEKYGLGHLPVLKDGDFSYYYFGQANRQVVLETILLGADKQTLLIDLDYQDKQLYELAEKQTESRKAAANKQIQNTLKGKF